MELGFGSLRGQLASLVAEKAQEASKRKDAEAECAAACAKRARSEKDQAALLTDAEQRTESAQSELRSLRSTVEQLRSDHEQERERREIAEEQLKMSSESAKKLAAELSLSQAATRATAAKLSQAEVQSSGFAHASASYEQNYNTVQQQIVQIQSASEKHTEHLYELQQTNTSLVDALRKSDGELSSYRDRDDVAAKAIQQAFDDKEAAQQKNLLTEAENLRLRREIELEKQAGQRNALTVQQVESERANMLQVIAEYDRIIALKNVQSESGGVEEASSIDGSQDIHDTQEQSHSSEEVNTHAKDETDASKGSVQDASDTCDDKTVDATDTCELGNEGPEPSTASEHTCAGAPAKDAPQQMELPLTEQEA